MKKFAVYIPIAGYVYKEVEAEDEESAIDKVFEEGYTDDDIQELEMYDKIVEGNVCHVYQNASCAEEIKD